MDEKETKINEIDMECNVDPEDDGFGSIVVEVPAASVGDDGREINTKTGIFADFSDDIDLSNEPVEVVVSKPLVVQSEQDILNAKNGVLGDEALDRADLSGINEIDMECSVGEDDDITPSSKVGTLTIAFDEAENTTEQLQENKESTSTLLEKKRAAAKEKLDGTVTANYWEKLAQKHRESQVKGALPHGHWAYDPKDDMEFFNQMNRSSKAATSKPVEGELACSGGQGGSNSEAGLPSFSDFGGMAEDLETSSELTSKLKDYIEDLEWKVVKKENNSGYLLVDQVYGQEKYPFNTAEELLEILKTYCDLGWYRKEGSELDSIISKIEANPSSLIISQL